MAFAPACRDRTHSFVPLPSEPNDIPLARLQYQFNERILAAAMAEVCSLVHRAIVLAAAWTVHWRQAQLGCGSGRGAPLAVQQLSLAGWCAERFGCRLARRPRQLLVTPDHPRTKRPPASIIACFALPFPQLPTGFDDDLEFRKSLQLAFRSAASGSLGAPDAALATEDAEMVPAVRAVRAASLAHEPGSAVPPAVRYPGAAPIGPASGRYAAAAAAPAGVSGAAGAAAAVNGSS